MLKDGALGLKHVQRDLKPVRVTRDGMKNLVNLGKIVEVAETTPGDPWYMLP